MKWLVLMALLLPIGCGPSRECIDQTDRLAASLAELPRAGTNLRAADIEWPFDMLVELDGGIEAADDIDPGSRAIFTSPAGIQAQYGDWSRARTVAEAMVALKDELDKLRSGRAGRVLLLPQWDTPWSVMATLLEALRELGEADVDVLFWRDGVAPAPPSSITAELQALRVSASQRMSTSANLAQKLFAPCATLEPLFLGIDWSDRAAGEQKIITGIPEALRGCGCSVDVAAVQSLVQFWFAPHFIPAVVRLQLASKATEPADPLVLGRDLTWLEVHGQVLAIRDRPMAYAWE